MPRKNHQIVNGRLLLITDAMLELFDRIVDKKLLVRRVNVTANRVVSESSLSTSAPMEQLDLFTDYERKKKAEQAALERERKA